MRQNDIQNDFQIRKCKNTQINNQKEEQLREKIADTNRFLFARTANWVNFSRNDLYIAQISLDYDALI